MHSNTKSDWLPLLIAFVCLTGFSFPLWSGTHTIGFRDTKNLYYPLYSWIEGQRIDSGETPLWNPHDDFGYSLLADGSSALCYPGKLVFRIPGIEFSHQLGIYLALHLAFAMFGAIAFARRVGAKSVGASIAGVTYAMGMPVAFQMANVIFLVGAACLPWTLFFGFQAIQKKKFEPGVLAGLSCALSVLGGDVEMAYVALLVLAGGAVWFGTGNEQKKTEGFLTRMWETVWPVVTVASVAIACSTVQWWPSLQMSKDSQRHFYDTPRSIWQIQDEYIRGEPEQNLVSDVLGLASRPLVGSHEDHAYQFSQSPWSLAGWVLPGLGGRAPDYTRWSETIVGEDRMWVPALYQGAWVPLLIVCVFFRYRFCCTRKSVSGRGVRFFLGVWLFFAIASWGWYGVGWLVRELGWNAPISFGEPAGGLYWWMIVLLPGFDSFRYPAKMMVVSSLAASCLAGVVITRNGIFQQRQLLTRVFVGYVGVLLIVAGGGYLVLKTRGPSAGQDEIIQRFWWGVGSAFAIVGLVGFGRVVLFQLWSRRQIRFGFGYILLLVTCVDLLVWNGRLLPWGILPGHDSIVAQSLDEIGSKRHLLNSQDRVPSFTSIESLAGEVMKQEFIDFKQGAAAKQVVQMTFRDWLSQIAFEANSFSGPNNVRSRTGLLLENLTDVDQLDLSTRRLRPSLNKLRNSIGNGLVDDGESKMIAGQKSMIALTEQRAVNIIAFDLFCEGNGVVVLPVRFDQNWRCFVNRKGDQGFRGELTSIYCVADLFCGVPIAAGEASLVFEQISLTQRLSWWVTIGSWIFCGFLLLLGMRRKRRPS